jgi:hypothetical protein
MKRANKITLLTLLSVMAVALLSIRPSAASPLVSPLPCAPDVTLPGAVCWVYPPDSSVQSVRVHRVALPVVGR